MSNTDREQWNKLYDYVKKEIMGYDNNQKLSNYMVLRLRGMKDGKFMANKSVESLAHYSYEIILLTFKYVKPKIDYKLKENNFVDDQHRFNFVTKIVNENLNLVYEKVKRVREEQNKIEKVQIVEIPDYENKYNNREATVSKKNMEEFW